jgi:nucleotide-binding universal stress UspA family protein
MILVGYNGRPESRDALALTTMLARVLRSRVVLAWVQPVAPLDVPYEAILGPVQARAENALAEVVRELHDDGVEAESRVGLFGSAAQGLQDFAEQESADLVVVGSSHRGRLGRVVAGTVGTRLLNGAPCPVAVAPKGFADTSQGYIRHVGVGFDGSPESEQALQWAERLAFTTQAELRLLVACEEAPERARRVLTDGLDRVTDCRATGMVRAGAAAEQLTLHSATVDLLVVGSRGYGPLRRVLLGTVSGHLVEQSHCPVVVTPRAAAERRRRGTAPAGTVFV